MKNLLLCALLVGASLHAAPIILADGELNESTKRDGQQASRSWDAGSGITMTVDAYSVNGSTFIAANSTQFGSNNASEIASVANIGLGICSTLETCSSPSYQIDNVSPGYREFLLFTFSSPVDIGSIVIKQTTLNNTDSDAGFAYGNGLTLAQLLAGLIPDSGSYNLDAGESRPVAINASGVTQLLFGTLGGDDRDDFFKAYSIDVSQGIIPPPPVTHVPEPASLALLGSGLLGLGLVARRRK